MATSAADVPPRTASQCSAASSPFTYPRRISALFSPSPVEKAVTAAAAVPPSASHLPHATRMHVRTLSVLSLATSGNKALCTPSAAAESAFSLAAVVYVARVPSTPTPPRLPTPRFPATCRCVTAAGEGRASAENALAIDSRCWGPNEDPFVAAVAMAAAAAAAAAVPAYWLSDSSTPTAVAARAACVPSTCGNSASASSEAPAVIAATDELHACTRARAQTHLREKE
eukprot:582444-Pleurochrysis_carterae.AAC.1